MEQCILESGSMMHRMDMGLRHGLIVRSTREHINWDQSKGLEFISGQMGQSTEATGIRT